MGRISIVGTGWTAGQLTLDAIRLLTGEARVLLHTARCGCAGWLEEKGVPFTALDALYEQCEDFDEHAQAAAQAVLDAAREADIVYGVADVRDRSVAALLSLKPDVSVIAGPPVEGALLAFAQGALRAVEASDWESFQLSARENCLVRELDTRELAAEVKLRLMEAYPEDWRIWLLNDRAEPEQVPLYALDRAARYDHRTCALIPACSDLLALERYDFEHLIDIVRRLVAPDGCPWDRVQTHQSLKSCIVEEAYEVVEAIDADDADHLYDELGDMLLQVALHAEIARKHGDFDISDVTTAICEKMISRHSHIFGSAQAESPDEVMDLWTRRKMAERGQTSRTEVLRGVSRALPALLRAVKVLKRAAETGLGEPTAESVFAACAAAGEKVLRERTETALGDALLALANAARALDFDPELALDGAIARFIDRFASVEDKIRADGGDFSLLDAKTLREYWELVKL